jgi:hypothetical protein
MKTGWVDSNVAALRLAIMNGQSLEPWRVSSDKVLTSANNESEGVVVYGGRLEFLPSLTAIAEEGGLKICRTKVLAAAMQWFFQSQGHTVHKSLSLVRKR